MWPRTSTASATATTGRTSMAGRSELSITSRRWKQNPRVDEPFSNRTIQRAQQGNLLRFFFEVIDVRNLRLAQAGADIELKNSMLDFDLDRRLINSSMASTVERGLSTLRSTHTRLNSSGGRSNSSLRVPERWMSMAGKTRLSARRRSR